MGVQMMKAMRKWEGRLGMSTQWHIQSKHLGNYEFIAKWVHLPTGRIFYSRTQAEAYDIEFAKTL